MTLSQATEMFEAKEYQDSPMCGRQSIAPLCKLGLVFIDENRKIRLVMSEIYLGIESNLVISGIDE